MHNESLLNPTFESVLAPLLKGHFEEKRASGYHYRSETCYLKDLDRFLKQEGHNRHELPKEFVERWISKRDYESSKTHSNRISIIRQFSEYLLRLGISAYVPSARLVQINRDRFVPHIFSIEDIHRILYEVDSLNSEPMSPLRNIIMPEFFRPLFCCGLR